MTATTSPLNFLTQEAMFLYHGCLAHNKHIYYAPSLLDVLHSHWTCYCKYYSIS